MADIKLFVCCHQPFRVPEHPLLVPVQVGTALTKERFPDFLHDDEGANISGKNRSYCELTAQFWAQKNVDADYYGFFHYRRYLYPNTRARLPYHLEGEPRADVLKKLDFDRMEEFVSDCDLVAPIGEDMHISVRSHYANAPFHHEKDLAMVEEIIRARHPEMVSAMEAYLSGTICYFGNIYIMSRAVFRDYCSWLFPILEQFDRCADLTGYGPQELRVDGYLAERLFGIYYTHHRKELKTRELPRVHFEGNPRERQKKQLLNILLPPGSRRRSVIKQIRKTKGV